MGLQKGIIGTKGIQRLIFRIDYGMSYEGNKKYMQGFKIFYGIR
jgi:hypothetical protein